MGKITQGILGGFSGKVGPVVGGKWKDVDYMRSYVIPANPNTVPQQAVRAKFAQMVVYAKQLLTAVLQIYWDPFISNMSGFNKWISVNYDLINATAIIDSDVVIAQGGLEPINGITSAVVDGTDLTVTFNEGHTGNGLDTDSILGVVYRFATKTFYFIDPAKTRKDSPAVFVVPSGTSELDLFWLFCSRGTGTSFMVSNSVCEEISSV